MNIERLIQILTILDKYSIEKKTEFVSAEHDKIWLSYCKNVNHHDYAVLVDLGAAWDEDNESWYCFV